MFVIHVRASSSGEREAIPEESCELRVAPRPDDGLVCPVSPHQSLSTRRTRTEGETEPHGNNNLVSSVKTRIVVKSLNAEILVSTLTCICLV